MGPDPILSQHLDDRRLAVGQKVQARWHDCRGRFSAVARILVLKPRSVRVELLQAINVYPVGHQLELPRISDFEHWTSDHGVRRLAT